MTSRYFSNALSATALTHCHIPGKESRDIKRREKKTFGKNGLPDVQFHFNDLILPILIKDTNLGKK